MFDKPIPATIEESQGGKLDPKYDYCLSPHSAVGILAEAGWRPCGEVKDSTLDQNGTLVALRRPKEASK